MTLRASAAKLEQHARAARQTLAELAKWPNGTAALSFGPLATNRLYALKKRGWATKSADLDQLECPIWRVTETGLAELQAQPA